MTAQGVCQYGGFNTVSDDHSPVFQSRKWDCGARRFRGARVPMDDEKYWVTRVREAMMGRCKTGHARHRHRCPGLTGKASLEGTESPRQWPAGSNSPKEINDFPWTGNNTGHRAEGVGRDT